MEDFSAVRYDPETGRFTWARQQGAAREGSLAGSRHNKGYWRVRVGYKTYLAHRLAWFISYGVWPAKFIDHINGDRMDNRLSNLRECDFLMNAENKRKPYSNNKSGYMGVRWNEQNKVWIASIRSAGKGKHIGCFPTALQAHEAYLKEKRAMHSGCTI